MIIQDIKWTKERHAPASRAISKAMWVRRYDAKRIAQYGRSRATLDATERRHQASIRPVLLNSANWATGGPICYTDYYVIKTHTYILYLEVLLLLGFVGTYNSYWGKALF
jgi:hypothetical protein